MNAGLIGSSAIMDKAASLEDKYKEVKANGKTIKRNKFGDTTILDPKFDKLKPAEKDQEGAVAAKKKKKGLSSSAKDKVKKIQTIIGVDADGSWGPKTTTAWKAWIVSPETKKGIVEAGMDDALTQQFLEDNKGKAAAIAKKAGYAANLQGVYDLVTTIDNALIPIEDEVDDEDISKTTITPIDLDMKASDVPAEARKGLKNVASRQFNLEGTAGGGKQYNNIVVRADGEGITFRQDNDVVSSIIIINDAQKLLEWAKWFNTRGYAFLKR